MVPHFQNVVGGDDDYVDGGRMKTLTQTDRKENRKKIWTNLMSRSLCQEHCTCKLRNMRLVHLNQYKSTQQKLFSLNG